MTETLAHSRHCSRLKNPATHRLNLVKTEIYPPNALKKVFLGAQRVQNFQLMKPLKPSKALELKIPNHR